MKYAIIENGVVTNVVISDAPHGANWRQDDNAGIGWFDIGGVLAAPVSPVPTRKDVINARLARIDVLGDKPRTRREMMLGNAATIAYATTLDNEAVALRTELAGLP